MVRASLALQLYAHTGAMQHSTAQHTIIDIYIHSSRGHILQFKKEKLYAEGRAPRYVDLHAKEKGLTEFGRMYNELPSTIPALDAVIEDLQELLRSTVRNEKVVDRYKSVSTLDAYRMCYYAWVCLWL